MTRFESSAQRNGKSARAAEWQLPEDVFNVSDWTEIGTTDKTDKTGNGTVFVAPVGSPLPGPTVAAIVSMFAEIGEQARRVSEALAPWVEAEQERRRRRPPMWAIDPARSKRPRNTTRRVK
jgi:hypothetical protein